MNKFIEKISQIENLKYELLNDLKADESLSKVEKLKLIDENNLFSIDPFIQHPFHDLMFKHKQHLETLYPNEYFSLYEVFNSDMPRYGIVNLCYYVENIKEEETYKVLIGDNEYEHLYLKGKEIIDHIYEWVLYNRCIKYVYDW